MTPGSIQPHPDAPEAFITMKAPPGMDNCVDLDYRIVNVEGRTAIMAEFVPSAEEIELIRTGQPVRFLMSLITSEDGRPIVPPIALWAKEGGEI